MGADDTNAGAQASTAAGPEWSGTALLRPGLLLLDVDIGTAAPHSHHTVQIMVARDGEFVLADASGRSMRTHAAVVPPDRVHAIPESRARGLIIHVDPESADGRRLIDLVEAADAVGAWCRAGAGVAESPEWFRDGEFRPALVTGSARPHHPAVARALAVLGERAARGPVRLADLAREVHLSESRLAHLFTSEMGLPLRPYVRWVRLLRAVELVAAGHTFTAAAHGAGFSDSAHLNRVCRSMFGSAPSQFDGIRWLDEQDS
ncbi:helix-turn-helix transcriptional regulator [Nocardia sp. 2]|uniref:Helix-turn-helix transcriptional regulator n=1 Tax=Nocardia acididurans TaxID=2802282 RepID=A0ABS1MCA3_9NOCA|nr:helix-turn-helix domain-containing protein [Nocardia acididurans]MBL1076823.1 helix-turn-helix transcriptional regulator [Nocardia acididurans]